jgi:hypothetical protein
MPVLLFGEAFWRGILSFDAMVEYGVIAEADLEHFSYVETAEDAYARIFES